MIIAAIPIKMNAVKESDVFQIAVNCDKGDFGSTFKHDNFGKSTKACAPPPLKRFGNAPFHKGLLILLFRNCPFCQNLEQ